MEFKGIRVLVLEGYARQSLPLLRAFHDLGCITSALCNSKIDVAYVSRYTDHKILGICDREKVRETTECVRSLLQSRNYDVVIPTVDFSTMVLSENKEEFSKYTKVASNDLGVFNIAENKQNTMEVCMANGIPCPMTLTNITSIECIKNSGIHYPAVVKPKVGYGAVGFKKVESYNEIEALFTGKVDRISDYVIQEYIPQTDIQYECAMFIDNNNEVKTSLVFSKNRWFPVSGGSSTLNITVQREDIIKSCTQLLKKINWRGAADIDLIQDPRDGVAKIMEINPRVSGSVKICFKAGVDQARQMLELVYGEKVTKYENYEVGRRLRCSQTDLLWFIKSPNRFKAKPSWFSNYKTNDQIFSWNDPIPWFAFSIQKMIHLKEEMSKRS